MARDLVQNSQVVQDPALPVTRQASRAYNEVIISAFDTALDKPLRMYASNPADSKLNFSASRITFPDGTDRGPGVAGGLPSFVASTVDFQTGGTTGGNIVISFPSTTVGQYRRFAFTLMPGGNLFANYTSQAASIGALEDPIFLSGGLAVGWVDVEATTSTTFKTIGSSSAIIENSVSSVSRVHNMAMQPVFRNTLPELVRGGTWGWTSGTSTLTWNADAFIQVPGLAEARNKIASGSSTLLNADGMVLYVDLNLNTGANATLTLKAASISSLVQTDRMFVIARRVNATVLLAEGTELADGESQELNTGISTQNLALLGSGVTETTSNPGYAARGAADRTIGDSQGFADAIASIDNQVDKFFGQLRIKAHPSNVSRAIVTGCDLTMLDTAVLSQEINGTFISFTGAQIDFSTGVVYASDGATPLGINFSPFAIPTSQYFWYGISATANVLGADNTVSLQMVVTLASAANASASVAPKPVLGGLKKSGAVLIQNVAGIPTVNTIRQLGMGAGGSVNNPLREIPAGTVNGSNTVFTLTQDPYSAAHTLVFLDSLLVVNSAWTLQNGNEINFSTAPANAQTLDVFYFPDPLGGMGGGGSLDLTNIAVNPQPDTNANYSLGTVTKAWKDIYLKDKVTSQVWRLEISSGILQAVAVP